MKWPDPDNVLWEMTRHSVDVEGDPLDDRLLQAYQAGDLAEDEADRVERALGDSAAARKRLAELAGLETHYAPASVRRTLLGNEPPNGAPRPSATWWKVAAAAVLVVALAGALAVSRKTAPGPSSQSAAFDGVEFDVTLRGSAVVRSDRPTGAEATPDSSVEIRIEARSAVAAPFQAGVYRQEGNELHRIDRGLEHQSFQGAATVGGLARDVAGADRPGDYRLYLVVAAPGELPKVVAIMAGSTPESSLAAPGRQVYSRTLTLLEARVPGSEEVEEDG